MRRSKTSLLKLPHDCLNRLSEAVNVSGYMYFQTSTDWFKYNLNRARRDIEGRTILQRKTGTEVNRPRPYLVVE